uniref:Uncharacterized protein n=1 Tax=Setaria italica TaxID=4555 RepID=K3ZNK3_SETIT
MFSNDAGEVTKGLKLSDLELHAITFVLEALAVDSNKDLVDIDGIKVTATHLKCLLRPVKENAVEKWLCSRNLVGHDMVTVTLNHSLPLLILMQILKVVVHVNVGLHSHEQYRKSLVALCSCGIFTIKYMQYWNGSKITSPFSQKDMETIRKEMPAELIMSPFNKLTISRMKLRQMNLLPPICSSSSNLS